MSDLFSGASNASQDQQNAGLIGLLQTQMNENNAIGALQSTTNQAAPYLQTNYNTGQQGVTALGNALGLNGPAGNQSALAQLQTTPGYQFTLGQGNNAINAAASANGTLNSGNQATALSKFNQGLAQTTNNNYVNQLSPYMNMAQNSGNALSSLYTGLGTNEANTYMGANNTQVGLLGSIGNAQASGQMADQAQGMSLLGGGLNLLSGGLGAIFSDERLKEDIEPVGELYDGQGIFRYRYKGDPSETTHIGLIAQDVENVSPESVVDVHGYKAVNYKRATDYASELASLLAA